MPGYYKLLLKSVYLWQVLVLHYLNFSKLHSRWREQSTLIWLFRANKLSWGSTDFNIANNQQEGVNISNLSTATTRAWLWLYLHIGTGWTQWGESPHNDQQRVVRSCQGSKHSKYRLTVNYNYRRHPLLQSLKVSSVIFLLSSALQCSVCSPCLTGRKAGKGWVANPEIACFYIVGSDLISGWGGDWTVLSPLYQHSLLYYMQMPAEPAIIWQKHAELFLICCSGIMIMWTLNRTEELHWELQYFRHRPLGDQADLWLAHNPRLISFPSPSWLLWLLSFTEGENTNNKSEQ